MDSQPFDCQHSIAFAVAPIQNCPYSTYDDGFDAVISNAYLHRQNCMDHLAAVVVALVAIAIVCTSKRKTNLIYYSESLILKTIEDLKRQLSTYI